MFYPDAKPRAVTSRRRLKFEARAETLEGRQLLTAGTLDTSFDGDGYAVLSSTQPTRTYAPFDIANAVDVLADGKVLVAGQGKSTFQVVRLLPGGQLDGSFGSGGRSMPLAGSARDMAVQSDGRIVLAGFTSVTTQVSKKSSVTHQEIALVRLLSDGSLDASFGQGGKVVTGISTSTSSNVSYNLEDIANAVAIQSDGKIVVGGVTYNGTASGEDSVLVRYNADGSLDVTFGQGGKVVTAWSASDEAVSDLAVQPDGKIVAAGNRVIGGVREPYVARFNADGSVDTTFGSAGLVTSPGASMVTTTVTQGLALLPSGAVLSSLKTFNGSTWDLAIAKYDAVGNLDTSFGGGTGYATVNLPGDEGAWAIKVQPGDGKVVAAGFSHAPETTPLLVRFHADGSLDTGFGSGGGGPGRPLRQGWGPFPSGRHPGRRQSRGGRPDEPRRADVPGLPCRPLPRRAGGDWPLGLQCVVAGDHVRVDRGRPDAPRRGMGPILQEEANRLPLGSVIRGVS